MKVILLCDVKKVGKKGELVDVSDGYGLNYLIPNRLAVKATKTSMEIKNKQEEEAKELDKQNKISALEQKEKMDKLTLELKVKSGKDGKIFGAISTKQIIDEYKNQFGIELDKRKIIDFKNIVSLGYTNVKIELYKGVIATIIVHVSEM